MTHRQTPRAALPAFRSSCLLVLAACAAMTLVACGKPTEKPAAAKAEKPRLQLGAEDVLKLDPSTVSSGPAITGSIQPERRADLRAEVGAVVLRVMKENGEPVKAGDVLLQLDETSIRDSLVSADEAVRAATQAFEQSERQVSRLKTLQAQGMISSQGLEDAEVRRLAAQNDVVAARARQVAARQQLARTQVRAPFDGLVSDRKVSSGDTVQVGRELMKVIDPRSMRFEGLVSADRTGELQAGQKVLFRVNGYNQGDFTGSVRRIDATANTTTRQVAVIVGFNDASQAPRVAGLFAEGRIESGSRQALVLPESAIVRAGDGAWAWKLADGKLQKATIKLGDRDARTGLTPVIQGLVAGDRVLRNPGSGLADGQSWVMRAGEGSASAPVAAAPAAAPASGGATAAAASR